MTPFPLLASLTYLKIRSWCNGTKHQQIDENDPEQDVEDDKEDPDRIDFKQSESSQKLMPIVKNKGGGGCALAKDSNGNF